MLTTIGLQARNKVEKYDHQTREAATRFTERLTAAEQHELAQSQDGSVARVLIDKAKLRFADEDAAALRAKQPPAPPVVATLDFATCATPDEVHALLATTQANRDDVDLANTCAALTRLRQLTPSVQQISQEQGLDVDEEVAKATELRAAPSPDEPPANEPAASEPAAVDPPATPAEPPAEPPT